MITLKFNNTEKLNPTQDITMLSDEEVLNTPYRIDYPASPFGKSFTS